MKKYISKKYATWIIPFCFMLCFCVSQFTTPVSAAISANCEITKDGSTSFVSEGVYKLERGAGFSRSGTVTIKNKTNDTRIFVINYDVSISHPDSYITVGGTKHTTTLQNQSYTVELAGNSSTTINMYIDKAKSSRSAVITFNDISDSKVTTASVKFASYDTNFATSAVGSYTITGVTASDYIDKNVAYPNYTSTNGIAVTAAAVSGYEFFGWIDTSTHELLAKTMSATLRPEKDCTISPVYIATSSTQGIFMANSILYPSWETAFAGAGSHTVILLRNCTLPAGTYTIGSNQKLLIPYDDKHTAHFDGSPNMVTVSTPTVYRTLTLADGAVIQCNGSINVGGQVSAESSSYAGRPTGAYGKINMLGANSKLVLASADSTNSTAGALYCYGFIIGSGQVVAESGASVYETFDACGFRGGTTTSGAWMSKAGLTKTYKSFLFSEYSIHNIELDFTIESGASWYTVASIAPSIGDTIQAAAQFAGTTNGMFRMGSDASLLRSYNPNTDRTTFAINGTVDLSGFVLSMGGTNLDTSQFILGINGGWDVVIESGTTTLNSHIKLMPGATMTIDEDGKLLVNKNLYIYDAADYAGKGYVYYRQKNGNAAFSYIEAYNCMPTQYIATTNKSYNVQADSFVRTISGNDHAKVIVDGTLEVGNTGGVYTTSNGGQSAGKMLLGEGTLINNSTTATGIVTDYLDELTWYYESWYSYGLTDNNIVVTPVVGLIAGLSKDANDYKSFGAATYHGSADGYWYEHTISQSVAGSTAEVIGYVGDGSTIAFNSSNVATGLTAAKGSYTFNPNGYSVSTSNGTLTDNENGTYTLSNVTADTVLTLTPPNIAKIDGKGQYQTLQKAVDAWGSGDRIEMLTSSTAATTIDKAVLIDLNGNSVSGVTVTAPVLDDGTTGVRFMDATANGYGIPTGKLSVTSGIDNINLVSDYNNGTTIKHYVKIANKDENGNPDGTYSFPRVGVAVTGVGYTQKGESKYLTFQNTCRVPEFYKDKLTDMGFIFNETASTETWLRSVPTGGTAVTSGGQTLPGLFYRAHYTMTYEVVTSVQAKAEFGDSVVTSSSPSSKQLSAINALGG